jgi:hypothetical protein
MNNIGLKDIIMGFVKCSSRIVLLVFSQSYVKHDLEKIKL